MDFSAQLTGLGVNQATNISSNRPVFETNEQIPSINRLFNDINVPSDARLLKKRYKEEALKQTLTTGELSMLGMLPQIPTLQQMCLHSIVQSEEASRHAKRMLTLRYAEACEFLSNVLHNTYFSHLGQPRFADDYITAFHVQTMLTYFQLNEITFFTALWLHRNTLTTGRTETPHYWKLTDLYRIVARSV